MGDELRGESLVHLNVRFSTETELKAIQDMLYEKSGQGVSFTGLVEAMAHEVTIVTAIHNIKSNKGSVPFPVSWTVKMKKKQKETQDILSYHSQAAGCSDKARAKASGGRQPIEECGRTGL